MADTNYDEKLSIAVDNIPVIYVKNKDCKDKLVVNKARIKERRMGGKCWRIFEKGTHDDEVRRRKA